MDALLGLTRYIALNQEVAVANGAEERRRPYAAPSNVISVIQRVRTRNMPSKIDEQFLDIAGVSANVYGRVFDALRFLDLIDEDGRPTDRLVALGAATDEEYPDLLATVVRSAYVEDFDKIDPGQDPQPKIVGAFRPYQPKSQTSRMVMLFLGLCREAGIPVLDAPRERSMRTSTPKPRTPSGQTRRRASTPGSGGSGQPGGTPVGGLLFGVTEADIAALAEEDFQEVWDALGKVARARARRTQQPRIAEDTEEEGASDTD